MSKKIETLTKSLTASMSPSELKRWHELAKELGKRPATMAREVLMIYLDKQTAQKERS